MRQETAKNGFSVVELLVVAAIIGILAAVVLATVPTARAKARDAKRIAELKEIQLALEAYKATHGTYPNGDFDGCGGWDVGNTEYQFFNNGALAGFMDNPPEDPFATGNCSGYFYYRYPQSTGAWYDCGRTFYVLMTYLEQGTGPTFTCSGSGGTGGTWGGTGAYVIGKFE